MMLETATLGQMIRRLRLARGLSQRTLAKAIGRSFTYVQQLEQDTYADPGGQTFRALAREFDVTVDYLLSLPRNPTELRREDLPPDLWVLYDEAMLREGRRRGVFLDVIADILARRQEEQEERGEQAGSA